MHYKFLILTIFSLSALPACASQNKATSTPIENLTCAELSAQISDTEVALVKAKNESEYRQGGISGVRTGGSVGVQGGSNSGIGVGVGISIGAPFGSNRYKRARLDVEVLQEKLIALQKQALEKKC